MTNHSPSPWRWEESVGYSALVDANGNDVLTYNRNDTGLVGSKADKALVAAAPDLLKLVAMFSRLPDAMMAFARAHPDQWENVQTVLASATTKGLPDATPPQL